MIIDRTFQNIQCDHCRALLDEEMWCDEPSALRTILGECGWIECEGGRHYCDECWQYDDDDNIVTGDGRKWSDYDHKEILTDEQRYGLSYLKDLADPRLTLTQLQTEIIKAQMLYRELVFSMYKSALFDEIEGACRLLNDRIEAASEEERAVFGTFRDHRIFYLLRRDGFPNDNKDVNIY